MAGGKETPRQKMIGMMYLVLTAMLALNVSKEILDAFITINNGLETTLNTFEGKLDNQYASFAASYNENKSKYGEAWNSAQQVQKTADELVDHINLIKAKTIAETEKKTIEDVMGKNAFGEDTIMNLKYVSSKDNYDVNTNLMIGAEAQNPKSDDHADGNNYRATVLKQKLEAYRDVLTGLVPENKALQASIDSLFSFPEKIKDASGTVNSWESINFYHVPISATTTILSKLQADVRTAESDVLTHLFADVEAASYKFTKLKPVVLPQKTYILEGDSFKADVFLAAYDDTNLPEIILASEGTVLDSTATEIEGEKSVVPVGSDGLGKLSLKASTVGNKHWEGLIKFKGPAGIVTTPFAFSYEVAKPSLVVSPTKMNVLYRGIENPISISVPGVSLDSITATISGGTLVKQSSGNYIAKPGSGTTAKVSVTAQMNGEQKQMGSFEFRLKSVPDPVATFAGKTSTDNTVSAAQLKAALGVIADLKDFEFDLKYPIVSFDLVAIINGEAKTLESKSNRLTADQQELIKQMRRNQVIMLQNIKAQAPDGSTRSLGNISLKII